MQMIELYQPGVMLKCDDVDQRERFFPWQILINYITDSFYEAHSALYLLSNYSVPIKQDYATHRANRLLISQRRSEIEKLVISEFNLKYPYDHERIFFETEKILRKEKLESGVVPVFVNQSPQGIYAKAFLTAFALIKKIIDQLRREEGTPDALDEIFNLLNSYFPHLTDVRNSTQHVEERIQGMAHGKKIKLKPITAGAFTSPTGSMVIGSFDGSKFLATKADGELGEIDVSFESLEKMGEVIQKLLDAFEWSGYKEILPRLP